MSDGGLNWRPLDIALARNVRRCDFGPVHALLKAGYAFGLAGTPAASEAAEMLERLAAFKTVTAAAGLDAGLVQAA